MGSRIEHAIIAQNPDPRNPRETRFTIQRGKETILFLSRWHTYPQDRPQTYDEFLKAQTDYRNTYAVHLVRRGASVEDAARITQLTPDQVAYRTKHNGFRPLPHEMLKPELPTVSLSDPEKSFYQGLTLGAFAVDTHQWNERRYVIVETQSRQTEKTTLLEETIGQRGEIHMRNRGTRVYLNDSSFEFLCSPAIASKNFDVKGNFAPFLLAILLTKLNGGNRFSLSDPTLLQRLNRWHERHFGKPLGKLKTEKNQRKQVCFIEIDEVKEILSNLSGYPTVKTLPFARNLDNLRNHKHSSQNTNGAKSPELGI